ncbi:MAG: GNAT family N-acetyltransferase, partial [Armatimonadota bacterium]
MFNHNDNTAAAQQPAVPIILHLPAGDADWAGILAQFTLILAEQEGKGYASWTVERLLRASRKNEGLVALYQGKLLGLMLFEVVDGAAEITLPWLRHYDAELAAELAAATLQVIRQEYPGLQYIRAERQLLPGVADPVGLEAVGFRCYWRRRMTLELMTWRGDMAIPEGYRVSHWQIRYLDAAADLIYRANLGTLDAILYAPFFGDSPEQCRKGLLAILAGRYGPIHQQATICVFQGHDLVGINLLINEGSDLASVVEISVDPAHQGKGLGRLLMTRSLRVLKNENKERVELAVTEENTHAVHLYESIGFIDSGQFPVCVWPKNSPESCVWSAE